MKKRLNAKSIRTVPLIFLAMALIAVMAPLSGCQDNQPAPDAPVSIDEGNGDVVCEAPAPCEPIPAEVASKPEEVVAANEEWFTTESVDGGVAITGWKQDVDLPSELVIPATIKGKEVVEIGENAFHDCRSLTSVVIPEGVKSIGDGAFGGWLVPLTNVVIPEGITSIGDGAFSGCSALTSVVIPAGVTNIGVVAFARSSAKIEVHPKNEFYSSVDGVLFDKDKKTLLHVPAVDSVETYSIPEGVASIGVCAFADCKALTNVVIPESVKEIGGHTFEGCSSLTSVVIPKGVEKIGEVAFKGCESLTSVVIPDGVANIGQTTFEGCKSLTSVVIPKSVKGIVNTAFRECPSKLSVYKDSYAEQWARENNREYEIIEEGDGGVVGEAPAPCAPSDPNEPIPVLIEDEDTNYIAPLPCVPVPPSSELATSNGESMPVEDGSKPSASEPAKNVLREWTDSTGAYRIKATFESQEGSNVQLRREDGKRIILSITKLSAKDRDYLAKLTEATPSEPEPSATEPAKNELREWTDSTGEFRIKATFEGREGSNVKLRREDGKRIIVPISKLSDADQDYLGNP